ncbi:Bgt-4284 [Blumeria graminis f. sp. tritici]|uniref:Dihydrolipoamide acetyltransferase component of pyruvate dehydrogenase complex n=2 Tax=Blumeria graminis f. sp. tritici TaxID=62690 RepID=A0A061HJZ1_BLUGR|nr:Dihydrolipoyl transsuccinylase [Blumeria graminis f. sp. tritici 96224]VDB90602.1 Bgt-4284 [Blumeria graminis f. sp. tritici]
MIQLSRRLSFLTRPWPAFQLLCRSKTTTTTTLRFFHESSRASIIKPFLMADIGEGITECEIIQWFVEPEARIEEWDKLCEVTSDKASVEITSRFAGVVKKLHYEPGQMVKVGRPLMDIDVPDKCGDVESEEMKETLEPVIKKLPHIHESESHTTPKELGPKLESGRNNETLATPAVRNLTKELNVKLEDVLGTGRNGRVLRNDVFNFAKNRNSPTSLSSPTTSTDDGEIDKNIQLTSYQSKMYKTMTNSLSIPHFLYADEIDFTSLVQLRESINIGLAKAPIIEIRKLSFLPFIMKAVSMSLYRYPILNAKLEHDTKTNKPFLTLRSQHNIGIAMDTPSGLLVPVVKNVSTLTILEIASELVRLQDLAVSGKLSSQDLTGGTITLSNIGSIGGTYVSPIIVEKELAILGIGKLRLVPAFSDSGELMKKHICNFSWSADHRIIDGATLAKANEVIRGLLENPASMILHFR